MPGNLTTQVSQNHPASCCLSSFMTSFWTDQAQTTLPDEVNPWRAARRYLRRVPLFALLDDDETAVLAGQVEVKTFAPRQRIWKIGDPGGRAYVMVSGAVRITTVDEDHQEVVVDQPAEGEFFGFASMLEQTPHQTDAIAVYRSRVPGGGPRRYRHSAAAQASRRDGHVDRAGPPVSRLPATGAGARQPQPQRHDRGGHDLRRAHRRPGGQLRRLLDIHHHLCLAPSPATPP